MSEALSAEATDRTVPVLFGGETYHVAPNDEWSIDALEASEAGKVTTAARMILGDEQYQAFRARHNKAGDLKELFAVIGEAMGGNS